MGFLTDAARVRDKCRYSYFAQLSPVSAHWLAVTECTLYIRMVERSQLTKNNRGVLSVQQRSYSLGFDPPKATGHPCCNASQARSAMSSARLQPALEHGSCHCQPCAPLVASKVLVSTLVDIYTTLRSGCSSNPDACYWKSEAPKTLDSPQTCLHGFVLST